MAPKAAPKATPAPPPVTEEEVQVPEGLLVPDPPFSIAVAHVCRQFFQVESPDTALRAFDPVGLLAETLKAQQTADPAAQRLHLVEKSELDGLAEGGPTAQGLVKKVENECALRRRRKVNIARRRAIALHEGREPEPVAEWEVGENEPDLLLLLLDFPANQQELEGLLESRVFELPEVQAFITLHLAGLTIAQEEDGRKVEPAPVPEILLQLHREIEAAPPGSGLANSAIVAVPNCQALAVPGAPAGGTEKDQELEIVCSSLLNTLHNEVARRLVYGKWLKVPFADPPTELGRPEHLGVYKRLADAVHPARHDVPLLLSFLCEQVAQSQNGDAWDKGQAAVAASNQEEFALVKQCLDSALGLLSPALPGSTASPLGKVKPSVETDGSSVIHHHDQASVRHEGHELPGGVKASKEVHRLLSHLRGPGVLRAGFPDQAPLTIAQRSALRNRVYSFLPDLSPVEIERLILLREFEKLLESVQPERKWSLADRSFHEKIPGWLLAQTLNSAIQSECFVDTAYMERNDCLLIALHHRSVPGRASWHSWGSDLLKVGLAADSGPKLCPIPSYSSWSYAMGPGAAEALQDALAPVEFTNVDAREVGFCQIVEKHVLAEDGAVVVVTVQGRGFLSSGPCATATGREGDEDSGGMVRPRAEMRLARIMKDGLVYGILPDKVWAEKAAAHAAAREEERLEAEARARAEAEAEAAQQAAGEDQEGEGDAEADKTTILPKADVTVLPCAFEKHLDDMRLGVFWLVFQDGARFNARIHWERPWYTSGSHSYDPASSRPGVLLTYSTSGLVLQVFSDGTLRQKWPKKVPLSGSKKSLRQPGSPEDFELARSVSPNGVLVRELLSGRKEVMHPDGVYAVRNPTLEEMRHRLELYQQPGALESAPDKEAVELLQGLIAMAEEASASIALPTEQQKAAGLPGHWRIARPNGRLFGRFPAPASAQEASPSQKQPSGTLVDDGATIEYSIQPSTSTTQVDPHTGQRVTANADGLLLVEDLASSSFFWELSDGTTGSSGSIQHGNEVIIDKQGAARVTCRIKNGAVPPSTSVLIECEDGVRLEVLPQKLTSSKLAPVDPAEDRSSSTNAAVVLRHPDGIVIRSTGAGDISVFSHAKAGASQVSFEDTEHTSAHVVHLDGAKISLTDKESSRIEVADSQSVLVQLAASSTLASSPRCARPHQLYHHSDAELPLPPEAPPVRLFAVFDGEAEELLPASVVERAVQQAQADPKASVKLGEQMGHPMECCRVHTIQRPRSLDPPVLQPRTLPVPPAIVSATEGKAKQQRTCTEFRQFMEYPGLSQEQLTAFQDAWSRHLQEEEEQRKRHEFYGTGYEVQKTAKVQISEESAAEGGA